VRTEKRKKEKGKMGGNEKERKTRAIKRNVIHGR
jgi:hypothetical protein